MIKAEHITKIDGKPITDVVIQGDNESIMFEFSAIIKCICRQPTLIGPAIKVIDDMIANIDDDIEQLLKENEDND